MNTEYTPTEEELTAYALGECSDSEKTAIETAVAKQPETAALLEAIRETVSLSEGLFAALGSEELSDVQRAEVASAAEKVVAFEPKPKYLLLKGLGAVAMVGIVASMMLPALSRARHSADTGWTFYTPLGGDEAVEVESFEHITHVTADGIDMSYEQAPKDSGKKEDADEEWFAEEIIVSSSAANNGVYVVVDAPKSVAPKPPVAKPKPKPEQKMAYGGGVAGRRAPVASPSPVSISGDVARVDRELDANLRVKNGLVSVNGNMPAPPAAAAKRSVPMRIARTPVATSEELRAKGISVDDVDEQLGFGFVDDDGSDAFFVQMPSQKPGEPYLYIPLNKSAIAPGSEGYDRIVESKFKRVAKAPLSTFSIDVDTASYSNMRRFLTQGQMPPVDAVRIEELINYFNYDYPQPDGEDPFSSNIEVASAPWNPQHKLVRIGLKGKDIVSEERPASNLVFLLDVSGSMSSHNKLPLVKQSIQMLTKQLTDRDRVAIVVYAGNSGLVLPSTPGNRHEAIMGALERLNAGGSTNGGAGIELAYRVATENFIKGGVNRVILASDGDFNVGNTSRGGLVRQIEQSAKSGVFLSVLGFGMGNLKDATMENLADKGNGNYAYIDTSREAQKVLVEQMNGTLYTIAKDVKIQVEFNPNRVQAYRLIGYENRALANRDFNDDTKDAGEIGAGHTVTALYEIIPSGIDLVNQPGVDKLKYQSVEEEAVSRRLADTVASQELLTVKLRYKQPDGHTSKLLVFPVRDVHVDFNRASKDFKFASAVAVFGMKLRHSPFAQHMSYDSVLHLANSGLGHDLNGYRGEFLGLVRQAKAMNPQPIPHQRNIR